MKLIFEKSVPGRRCAILPACDVPKAELPAGNVLTFAVRPLSSLGTKGKAIAAKYAVKAKVRS